MSSFVVGLTGGIGSGKTAVSDRFRELGIDVVDADLASRAVLAPAQPAVQAIAERFGPELIGADGSLDRAELRRRVFANPAERRWLEALTRPLIAKWLHRQLADAASPYAILVNPLLIETGHARVCQRVLVVDAPETLQLQRTMRRDGNDETQVRAIMAAQASREARLAAADDVIVNDGNLADLDEQVRTLHQKYLEMAAA
jgi:dephospho-CoA kinase